MEIFTIKKALAWACILLPALGQAPHHKIDPAVFPRIKPSDSLEWHDCYGVFKCARLTVPAKIEDSRRKPGKCNPKEKTVQLAVVKLPYVPAPGGPPRKGAVHVALGGGSSSSTNFLVRFGEDYAPLFAGHDLIAIDYRGWGWSTPAYRCFADEKERQAWAASEPALLGSGPGALQAREKRADKFAEKCQKNGGDVAEYMGTYAAAVDHYAVMRADKRTKMSFWGISSGSQLGQSIAMLYPEAVDKFFLDSIVPSQLAYTVSLAQPSQLAGSQRALEAFFYTCLRAGPEACAFLKSSTTVRSLRARHAAVDAAIRRRPLPVAGGAKPLDWSALHLLVNAALYTPAYVPVLAGVLSEAEAGPAPAPANGWTAYALSPALLGAAPAPLPLLDEAAPLEGIYTGVCLDERAHLPRDGRAFARYFGDMRAAAPAVAPVFADFRLVCSRWRVQPRNVFPADVLRRRAAVDLRGTGGKVVLFNNVADPAASVAGAESVQRRFVPSVLVENVAAGHTSFVAAGDCFYGVMYGLFVLGQMPAEGTKCSNITGAPFGVQLPLDF